MDSIKNHLFYNESRVTRITNPRTIINFFQAVLRQCGAEAISHQEHHRKPKGYSCMWLLPAGHLAVHTYPEDGISCWHISTPDESLYRAFLTLTKDI